MIFHASIPADDPGRVAAVLADLLGGQDLPFPPWPDSRVIFSGIDRTSSIEIMPRDKPYAPGPDGTEPGVASISDRQSAWHLLVGTTRTVDDVRAIAKAAGWRMQLCNRGGMFDVMEVWVENAVMLEVVTEDMQNAYRSSYNPENWRAVFGLPAAA
jgi:hypothetical protein